jgi:hypothetical protein
MIGSPGELSGGQLIPIIEPRGDAPARLVADEGFLPGEEARARRMVAAHPTLLLLGLMMEPPSRCPGDSAAPSFVREEGEAELVREPGDRLVIVADDEG